jgi:long-chain acyl-CoA synthetase
MPHIMPVMSDSRPWLDRYPPDVPVSLEPYPATSLFSLLQNAAGGFGRRTAIAFFGRHISYQHLLAEVERFSAVLAGLGVRKGDRVGLLLPNCPEYVIAFYACQRIGAIVVGCNPLSTERELEHQLKDARVSMMIVLDQVYAKFGKVRGTVGVREVIGVKLNRYMGFPFNVLAPLKFRREAKKEGHWPFIPSGHSVRWWSDLMRRTGPVPPVAQVEPATDVAAFLYTGGTTGLSKGAMLSHRNLVANAMQASAWLSVVHPGEGGLVVALPFFHSFGTLAMNFGVSKAAKLVLVPRFDLKMVLQAIAKEKPTLFPGVPRMFLAMSESPLLGRYDLKSLQACISGAAPLPLSVAKRFEERAGTGRVVEGYGLTECSPVTHANPLVGERKEGFIGMPLPDTDVKLVHLDEPDTIVPRGERGEMCVKGPQVMLGYWNKPEATALMIRDGWLHTGDVAIMDDDGYFRIVDRIKDMILVSGFNVYPTEIEEALYRHPKISKVAVVGLPDPVTGEHAKAYIVLKEGEAATAAEIVAWCRDEGGLSGYRVPKDIEFRDSLPETLIGKVLRRVLQEEERRKAAASG